MCLDVGEVHYIRNGHHISTLMHVDTSLPLWALFDIYGTVQKVRLLGSYLSSLLWLFYVPAVVALYRYCVEFSTCRHNSHVLLLIMFSVQFSAKTRVIIHIC